MREKPERIEVLARHPHVAGTQLSYSWGELEPRAGAFAFDRIEQDMEPWAREGKKCWIEISTATKRDKGDRGVPHHTPDWVWQQGVPKIQGEGTAPYPVYWDPKYLDLWGRFVVALAQKFDGDPRLEFVSTGGYSSGHEPNLSSWDNDALMDQWKKAGFDGFHATGVYLDQAIKPILRLFGDAFRKTPVAQTIHVKTDFDRAMNEYAAGLKFILISNGLSSKVDATSRQEWRDRREKLATKVGYAEWGPTGRETDADKRSGRARAKRDKREGKDRDRKERDRSTMAKLIDVYRAAIGDDEDPALEPASRISYLPLDERIPEVESLDEWNAALEWAGERLEK